jgi:hypothetical protein
MSDQSITTAYQGAASEIKLIAARPFTPGFAVAVPLSRAEGPHAASRQTSSGPPTGT